MMRTLRSLLKSKKEPSAISKLLKKVGMDKATDVPKTWLPVYKPTGDKELDAVLDEVWFWSIVHRRVVVQLHRY